jgi:hypothetical protein
MLWPFALPVGLEDGDSAVDAGVDTDRQHAGTFAAR